MLKILPRNSKQITPFYLGSKKPLSLLRDEFSECVIQSQTKRRPTDERQRANKSRDPSDIFLSKPSVWKVPRPAPFPQAQGGRATPRGTRPRSLGPPSQTATCFSRCAFGPRSTFIIFGRVCRILWDSNYIFQGRLPARAQKDDQQALFNHLLRFQPRLVINVLWKPLARTTLSGYVTRLASGRGRLERRTGKYYKQQRQKFGRS